VYIIGTKAHGIVCVQR